VTNTSIRLATTLEATRSLTPWINELLDSSDFAAFRRRRSDIELALHEVATNVITHAFGVSAPALKESIDVREQHVDVSAEIVDALLVFHFRDRGAAFEPDNYVEPDPAVPQVHGYGLMILDQLCESCVYQRNGGENFWDVSFARTLTSVG